MDKIKGENKNLFRSARIADPQGVEMALASGAQIDAKDWHGWTAAMLAAANGHGACLGVLIAAGAGLEAKANNGWTAAIWAARYGHGGCLGLLIAAGADVEAKDHHGLTAAMLSADHGHPEVALFIDGVLRSRREAAELELSSASPAVGAGGRGLRV